MHQVFWLPASGSKQRNNLSERKRKTWDTHHLQGLVYQVTVKYLASVITGSRCLTRLHLLLQSRQLIPPNMLSLKPIASFRRRHHWCSESSEDLPSESVQGKLDKDWINHPSTHYYWSQSKPESPWKHEEKRIPECEIAHIDFARMLIKVAFHLKCINLSVHERRRVQLKWSQEAKWIKKRERELKCKLVWKLYPKCVDFVSWAWENNLPLERESERRRVKHWARLYLARERERVSMKDR